MTRITGTEEKTMKNALPMSQIMDIYAILREVESLPTRPTPEQVGRLRADAGFQVALLRLRIDDIKRDVEVV
jgi:hypothetical protein